MRLLLKLSLGALLLGPVPGQRQARALAVPRGADDDTAAGLLSSQQGQGLARFALQHGRGFRPKPDCSHLVHKIYSRAGLYYPYAGSRDLYYGAEGFERVRHPQPGDLIVWLGHVGIVVSPEERLFFSSVRSGIITESWTADYWRHRGHPHFLRYRIGPETDLARLDELAPRRHGRLRHRQAAAHKNAPRRPAEESRDADLRRAAADSDE